MKRVTLRVTRQDRATRGGELGHGRLVNPSRYGLIPNWNSGQQVMS